MINAPTILRLIVYSLATFRVTMLLHNEEGPWALFDWFRFKMGLLYRSETASFEFRDDEYQPFIGKLLQCPLCLSGWLMPWAVAGSMKRIFVLDVAALWLFAWSLVYLTVKVAKK